MLESLFQLAGPVQALCATLMTWALTSLGACVIIFAVQLLRAGGFSFEVILNSFMIAVSLAVARVRDRKSVV